MKKYGYLILPLSFIALFVIYTILVRTIDVSYQSDINAYLGFSRWNHAVDDWVNYDINAFTTMKVMSDIIFYVSFIFPVLFGVLFCIQWIKRKSLKAIDRSLYIMLGTSVIACFAYLLFEVLKINYSPLSVVTNMKASYPSTHVFLGCVFYASGVATIYDVLHIESKGLKAGISIATIFLLLLLGFVRLLSRRHWISDILGAYILVAAILTVFFTLRHYLVLKKENELVEAE